MNCYGLHKIFFPSLPRLARRSFAIRLVIYNCSRNPGSGHAIHMLMSVLLWIFKIHEGCRCTNSHSTLGKNGWLALGLAIFTPRKAPELILLRVSAPRGQSGQEESRKISIGQDWTQAIQPGIKHLEPPGLLYEDPGLVIDPNPLCPFTNSNKQRCQWIPIIICSLKYLMFLKIQYEFFFKYVPYLV